MAIKDATCPVCGKSIKLNDEKPFGFCSFCGHKIDTAEYFSAKVPKASAVQAETDKPEPAALNLGSDSNSGSSALHQDYAGCAEQRNQPDRSDVYALLDRTGIHGPASART